VGKETVRRILMEHDIWKPGKLARIARKPRLRRGYFGELVQIDSSYHQWFTGNETYSWLLNIIDDATGRIFCRFVDSDSYRTNMAVFKSYIEVHGRPKEVYTDRASHFCDNIPKGAERKKAITQWERATGRIYQILSLSKHVHLWPLNQEKSTNNI
jgi:transposase InsO family protein